MNKKLFNFLWTSIRSFKVLLIINIFLIMVTSVIFCIQPYIIKIILDRLADFTANNVFQLLAMPVMIYMSLEILVELIYSINDFIWLKIKPNLAKDLTVRLINKMMAHSFELYQNNLTGNLSNRIKDVISYTPELLEVITDSFLSTILTILVSIITLFYIKKVFALLLILWTITFFFIATRLSNRISELSVVSAQRKTKIIGYIVDFISNISVFMLFSGKKTEEKILHDITDKFVKSDQTRDKFMIKAFAVQRIVFILYQLISIYILILGLKNGTNTIGDFGLILNINLNLVHEMWFITEDMGDFSKQVGNIIQGLEVALQPVSISDKPKAKQLQVTSGEIKFQNVYFYYENKTPLFEDLSITIPAKQKIGLVGYSGSGKSSFIKLLLRFFEPSSGAIYIDNQDIVEVKQDSLRANISLVPQDTMLFHRTIMENIRYAKPDATDEEVIEASKKGSAHEFITNLPEAYSTIVGERGAGLSGGQRQRIAISRAILKDAPILILDEATSSIDTLTEANLQRAVQKFSDDKTTIIITHRLNILLDLDRVLVFDKGKIVQDGSHHQLINEEGLYKILWNSQIDGYLPEQKISLS
jgi:ATP-binding cassette subfamily B protein